MRRSGFKRKYRANKYKAIKTERDGILFDSKLEASQYEELKLLQAAGEIKNLELQYEFTLAVNNRQICIYIADFVYFDCQENKWVCSDAKGVETDVFKIKKKLFQAIFPEWIFEIRKRGKVIRS